ncbi:MAG: YdcF family protein [Burkholderiaceae bacterium]
MMFFASQVLAFAKEPLFWAVALLGCGLLLLHAKRRLGIGLAWAALAVLVGSGWTFIPDRLLRTMESRHPPIAANARLNGYTGIVLLGGALAHSNLWEAHKQVALNDQAERMTAAVALMRTHPQLKLLFTGGIATIPPRGLSEAQRARQFFDEMGVDPARVLYEDQSRNTAENATLSAKLPGVNPRQPWLLLTSAYHMPRSMGVFLKAGWNVTPYPVDYRTTKEPSWLDYSLHDGARRWELALHELIGYYVYRWNGLI